MKLGALLTALVFGPTAALHAVDDSPRPWPNTRNVRTAEPGAWQPPRTPFDRKAAARAVVAPFLAGLQPEDRRFGEGARDVHVAGFVRLSLGGAKGKTTRPCEVAVVEFGPRDRSDWTHESPVQATLLVTSRGKVLSRVDLGESGTSVYQTHHMLSRVMTQFGQAPLVLLFSDSGANTRGFTYELYRVALAGLEKLWESDWDDGHTGSMHQGFGHSNFDFSELRLGRRKEFSVYTVSGVRRWLEPGDEEKFKTEYTRRVYRWNDGQKQYVKALERSSSKW